MRQERATVLVLALVPELAPVLVLALVPEQQQASAQEQVLAQVSLRVPVRVPVQEPLQEPLQVRQLAAVPQVQLHRLTHRQLQ